MIKHLVWEQRLGEARADNEMNRLSRLKGADMMDKVGNKTPQAEIATGKVTPTSVRSVSPAVRTRCTIAPLPDLSFGSMQTGLTSGSSPEMALPKNR
jgi:hypothetical protein